MMRLIAVAILSLAHLTGFSLNPSVQSSLESKIVTTEPASAFIYSPSQHTATLQPIKTGASDLTMSAAAVIAQDINSNTVLYQKNANQRLPIASITKLATALVILQRHDLTEVITIPTLPSYASDEDTMGLTAGQQFRVIDLLRATLIESANDAADALAIADSGTKTAFSARMNRLIASWGLEHTRYNNPSGLIDEGNYSSASDLAKLAKLALTNPTLRQIVTESQATITDTNNQSFQLKSTNKLLADNRFHGIKTGYTMTAGQSFLGLATVNGHQVITVVLNSPDRFGETSRLADWIQKEFTWQ